MIGSDVADGTSFSEKLLGQTRLSDHALKCSDRDFRIGIMRAVVDKPNFALDDPAVAAMTCGAVTDFDESMRQNDFQKFKIGAF